MTADKTYNGWTNYETWNVKLWMDNERGSYEAGRAMAREAYASTEVREAGDVLTRYERATYTLADQLKEEYEERSQEILEAAKATGTVWADLLSAALSEVNWDEIAKSMLNDEGFEE